MINLTPVGEVCDGVVMVLDGVGLSVTRARMAVSSED